MNNNMITLSDIIKNCFRKEVIAAGEKCVNDIDVIKCAESIRDLFNDSKKLKFDSQRIAAILIAEKLIEDDLKNANK